MMKIHVLSDLHVEFAPFHPPKTDADVVVLAGDIHTKRRSFSWARKSFPDKKIVAVLGNHELYKENWNGLVAEMRKRAREHDIHFLEDERVEIDGVRFLGATLWTDFLLFGEEKRAQAQEVCIDTMSDFRRIRVTRSGPTGELPASWGMPTLPISFVQQRHSTSRKWLEGELEKPFDGPTVVITHHLPSALSVAERFADDMVSASYASRLDDLVARSNLWIHGHAHDSFDYRIGEARVVCNPRGYCSRNGKQCENQAFDPSFLISL